MSSQRPEGSGQTRPATAAPPLWTLANALTATRLLLAPAIAFAIVHEASLLALGVYLVAIASDFIDGRVARHRGEVTPFGGFFDHVTDAVFVASGLAALAAREAAPVWLAPLLLAAFAQYTLDSRALQGQPLRASRLGRWNGIAYFVALGTPVIRDGLGLDSPADPVVLLFGWLLVASTLLSMADRAIALTRARAAR